MKKVLLLSFAILTISSSFADDGDLPGGIVDHNEWPKFFHCKIMGTQVPKDNGRYEIAHAKTKLVYNKGKPVVDATSHDNGIYYTRKLNSRKTKPLELKFNAEKIDITNPKAGPIHTLSAKIFLGPKTISYFSTDAYSMSSHFGFDLASDSEDNAVTIEYVVDGSKTVEEVKIAKNEIWDEDEVATHFTYFTVRSALGESDELADLLTSKSTYPQSHINHLRFVVDGKSYLKGISVDCSFDRK